MKPETFKTVINNTYRYNFSNTLDTDLLHIIKDRIDDRGEYYCSVPSSSWDTRRIKVALVIETLIDTGNYTYKPFTLNSFAVVKK